MIRVSKLTDYATVLCSRLARSPGTVSSAQALAEATHLELPTVSKVLKQLHQAGLLESFRGASGGYRLARPPEAVAVIDVITAMEGPFGMTECSVHAGLCNQETVCQVKGNWRVINDAIVTALEQVSLADMARPSLPGGLPRVHVRSMTAGGRP